MKALIIGGSGSGKSEYAESLLDGCQNKIYIATMQPFGQEAEKRIERHRRQRAEKGFKTVERYTDLGCITEQELPYGSSVIMECLGNLAANEMFGCKGECGAYERIVEGISLLEQRCDSLVVVTNDVFCDAENYSFETEKYIKLLAELNRCLAERFDTVAEVVCGIPLLLKGAEK